MEEFDETDKHFKPCPCHYQICRFCWNHINTDLNGLCPACRRPYSDDTMEFRPMSNEELQKIRATKKKKQRQIKEQEQVQRKQLANVRVVQKNLVYVLGLSPIVAIEEVLRQHDYFGQYGKITKVVINRRGGSQTSPLTATNNGVYITFEKKSDAAASIDAVDGSVCDGRMIRGMVGWVN
jgi:RNA recognition motif-containing protein